MTFGPAGDTFEWNENHPDVEFVVVAPGRELHFTNYKEAALAAVDVASESRTGAGLEVHVLSEDGAYWWDGETYAGEPVPYVQRALVTVRER